MICWGLGGRLTVRPNLLRSSQCSLLDSSHLKFSPQRGSKSVVKWSSTKPIQPQQYCSDLVRKRDYPQYVCGLLLKSEERRIVFALRALNIEVSGIQDMAHTQEMASLRLEWWQDSINSLFSAPHSSSFSSPIQSELAIGLQKRKLTKAWFKRFFSARSRDINGVPIMTLSDLEQYAENTASSLLYLALECGGHSDRSSEHAASHLGKAMGISTILRGLHHHLENRQNYLPHQLLAHSGLNLEDYSKGAKDDPSFQKKLSDVVYEVASIAKSHLDVSKGMCQDIPKVNRPFFLPALLCEDFLLTLEKVNFDGLHPSLMKPTSPSSLMRLYWNYYRSSF